MSRSRRKAILKDRPRNYKKSSFYWRRIRRVWKNQISSSSDLEFNLKSPRTICDDYDYIDWIVDYEYTLDDPKQKEKYQRK